MAAAVSILLKLSIEIFQDVIRLASMPAHELAGNAAIRPNSVMTSSYRVTSVSPSAFINSLHKFSLSSSDNFIL